MMAHIIKLNCLHSVQMTFLLSYRIVLFLLFGISGLRSMISYREKQVEEEDCREINSFLGGRKTLQKWVGAALEGYYPEGLFHGKVVDIKKKFFEVMKLSFCYFLLFECKAERKFMKHLLF